MNFFHNWSFEGFSEISEFSYLTLGQIRKLKNLRNWFLSGSSYTDAFSFENSTISFRFHLWKLNDVVSFSPPANTGTITMIRKTQYRKRNDMKTERLKTHQCKPGLSFRNDSNCPTKSDLPKWQVFLSFPLNCFKAKEQSYADFRDFRVFVFSIRALNSKTRKSRKDFSQVQEWFELSN